MFIHKLVTAIAALVLSVSAFAQAAKVTAVSGDVTYKVGNAGAPVKVAVGNDIPAGAVLSTGAKSQAVMRFQDGGTVALAENTNFNLIAFNYNAAKPGEGSSAFDLIRGAFRFVTGALGAANPSAVRITSGTATVGIRGTDFIVANVLTTSGVTTTVSVSVNVVTGAVSFTTATGTLTIAAGGVASASFTAAGAALSAPVSVSGGLSSLGVNVQSLVTQLQSISVSAAAGAGVVSTGATATVAGVSVPVAGTVAATAAAVAGVVQSNTQTSATAHHSSTSHH